MPIPYLIPSFIAMLLVMAIPFFNGREYRLLLKLILGLTVIVVPMAIAATEARNVFEFLSVWFLVLLAPFLWLFGGVTRQSETGLKGGDGLFAQLLPWLPLVAIGVVVVMVVALKILHARAQRSETD